MRRVKSANPSLELIFRRKLWAVGLDPGMRRARRAPSATKLRSLMISIPSLESMPRTFAEFFAGIGLMRMGLEAEGWTIASG